MARPDVEGDSTTRADLAIDMVNQLCAKVDVSMEEFRELVKARANGNTQTVIHKTAGIGPWAAAAVTACFCTLIGLVLLSIYIIHTDGLRNDDIRDLKAWQQIHEKRLNQLERKP
jgi:hypothetical protein